MTWVSALLGVSVLVVIGGSLYNRTKIGRGIGWQFIRYNVIAISIPVAGLLALNEALTGEAAAIIAGAMGYAFGKQDGPAEKSRKKPGNSKDALNENDPSA